MPRRAILESKIRVAFHQAAAAFPADLSNRIPRLGVDDSADHRHPRLDNARLLSGNCGERVSQLLRMVEADVGDDRDCRLADIGRIEPSAQADFKHGCLGVLSSKVQQGHGRRDFKERGTRLALICAAVEGRHGWPNEVDQCRKLFGRARLAADGNALFDFVKVRRRKQAGPVSGSG